MKKTTFFITAAVFFLVSSCIPSLHSIVNEENRVTDDRLVGDWKMEEDVSITHNYKITTDDEAEKQKGIEELKKIDTEMKGFFRKKEHYSLWKFERAAIITAVDDEKLTSPKGHGMEVIFRSWTTSLVPEEWTIIERKELPYYILTYKKTKGKKELMKVELTKINGNTYMDIYPMGEPKESRFGVNQINAHTFAKVEMEEDKLLIRSFDVLEIEDLLKNKKIRLKHEMIPYATFEKGDLNYEENIVLTASTKELRAFIAKYGDKEDLFDEAEELTAYVEKNP